MPISDEKKAELREIADVVSEFYRVSNNDQHRSPDSDPFVKNCVDIYIAKTYGVNKGLQVLADILRIKVF